MKQYPSFDFFFFNKLKMWKPFLAYELYKINGWPDLVHEPYPGLRSLIILCLPDASLPPLLYLLSSPLLPAQQAVHLFLYMFLFFILLFLWFLTLTALGQEYWILDLRESSHILETSPWSLCTSFSRKLCPCEHPISSPKLPRTLKSWDFMLFAS